MSHLWFVLPEVALVSSIEDENEDDDEDDDDYDDDSDGSGNGDGDGDGDGKGNDNGNGEGDSNDNSDSDGNGDEDSNDNNDDDVNDDGDDDHDDAFVMNIGLIGAISLSVPSFRHIPYIRNTGVRQGGLMSLSLYMWHTTSYYSLGKHCYLVCGC